MRIRIAVLLLSALAVALAIAKALRFALEHDLHLPLRNPFFIFLLPAFGLIALTFLSLFFSRSQITVASFVFVTVTGIASLLMPTLLIPLAISVVGVIALNLVRDRDGRFAE
jgi:hypothetical protein